MLGLIVILVLAFLVAWGVYFYHKVGQLDRIIAQQRASSSKLDNGN